MGSCLSSNTVISPPTARMVLEDGRLEEFVEPMRVALIMEENPGYFVCHSDRINFDEYVFPVPPEEGLEVGQLYFLLPEAKLRHPIPAYEVALLAVRANAATNRAGTKGLRSKIMPLIDDNYGNRTRNQSIPRDAELKEVELCSSKSRSTSNAAAAAGLADVGRLRRVASRRTKLPIIDENVIC